MADDDSRTSAGATTPRARARARTEAEILRIARDHLVTTGAAGLSLRAIARELGVVSSAVYRYVRSRDELLTLLVVDCYRELGNAVDSAMAEVPVDDHHARFRSLGRAVRGWAIAEPASYALLYGTPVPGYRAPGEQTVEPGTRVIRALISLVESAWQADRLTVGPASPEPTSEALADDLVRIRDEFDLTVPDEVMVRTILVWGALFGSINFELFGQYGPDTITDAAGLFEQQLRVLAGTLGLSPTR